MGIDIKFLYYIVAVTNLVFYIPPLIYYMHRRFDENVFLNHCAVVDTVTDIPMAAITIGKQTYKGNRYTVSHVFFFCA